MIEWDEELGLLFTPWMVVLLCLWWTALWRLSRFRSQDLVAELEFRDLPHSRKLQGFRRTDCSHFKNLRRKRIFGFVAVLVGVCLCTVFLVIHDPPNMLLTCFTVWHQLALTMAVGHWVNSISEEYLCRQQRYLQVEAHMLLSVMPKSAAWRTSAVALYHMIRHATLVVCVGMILSTRTLGGVGAMLLLLELPTIFLVRREMYLVFEHSRWMVDSWHLRLHWLLSATAVVLVYWLVPCLAASAILSDTKYILKSLDWCSHAVLTFICAICVFGGIHLLILTLEWFAEDLNVASFKDVMIRFSRLQRRGTRGETFRSVVPVSVCTTTAR